jgi:hypothetical protein
MDALTKLKELYEARDRANEQIQAIEQLLGADPIEAKPKKERKPQTCSKCGSESHSARTCPDKMPPAMI